MMEATIERLRHLVAEKLDMNIKLEEIDADAPLLEEGLKLDSLAIVELITLVEGHFGIEFAEDDLNMDAFANLRALAAVIDDHCAGEPAWVDKAYAMASGAAGQG